MSARNRMTMRAAVERDTATGADDYGMPAAPGWTMLIPSLACWLYSRVESEVLDTRKTAVVEDLRMLVPKGTDISERDRINGVTDRRGNVVRAGLLAIESVISRRSHLELVVRGVA